MDNFKFPASLNPDTSHLYANTQLFISSTAVLTAILFAPEINQAKHWPRYVLHLYHHHHRFHGHGAVGLCANDLFRPVHGLCYDQCPADEYHCTACPAQNPETIREAVTVLTRTIHESP